MRSLHSVTELAPHIRHVHPSLHQETIGIQRVRPLSAMIPLWWHLQIFLRLLALIGWHELKLLFYFIWFSYIIPATHLSSVQSCYWHFLKLWCTSIMMQGKSGSNYKVCMPARAYHSIIPRHGVVIIHVIYWCFGKCVGYHLISHNCTYNKKNLGMCLPI